MDENKKTVEATQGRPPERKKEKKDKKKGLRRRPVGKFGKFLLVLFVIFLCVALVGVLTAAAVGTYYIKDIQKYAESDNMFNLEAYTASQDQTSIIYAKDKDGKYYELTRLHGTENRIWVSLKDIPVNLRNAYIALEDKRFNEHHGVDWVSTISVSIKGFQRGGSTITQQLIKNLTGESGRTFSRKYREMKNALYLEKHYSKDTILEAYLNTLYLDEGCYGVKTAAEFYFGKDVKDLTLAECATIAAITKAPRTYNPIRNYENNRTRMQLCLKYMLEQGKINSEEYLEALQEEIRFSGERDKVSSNSGSKENVNEVHSYYVDFVIDRVISDIAKQYNMTEGEATRMLYYGGLKIYTAVDMHVQETMEHYYYNRIGIRDEEEGEEPIQSAMTIMDYDGRVLGIVGRLGEKTANRVLNLAADAPRQPGSSIKPLSVYAPAIDTGEFTWSSMLLDYSPMTIGGSPWPKNYGGGTGSGQYLTLPEAIAPSYNTIPARIIQYLGIGTCFDYLTQNFHISTATEDDQNFSSLAVGGMQYGVTTLEMAAAYITFGNGGKYYTPWCYYKVERADGSLLLQPDLAPEQAISEGSASVMNKMLQTVVTSGNGTMRAYRLKSGVTMYAKTGTTTDNYDMWTIGGTPYYLCAVWSGYEKKNKAISKAYFDGSPASILFDEVMDDLHEGLDDEKDFEYSDDLVRRAYCTESGKLCGENCTPAYGWYDYNNLPRYCDGSGHLTTETTTSAETTTAHGGMTKPSTTSSGTTKPPSTTAAPTTKPPSTTVAEPAGDEGGDED